MHNDIGLLDKYMKNVEELGKAEKRIKNDTEEGQKEKINDYIEKSGKRNETYDKYQKLKDLYKHYFEFIYESGMRYYKYVISTYFNK